MLVIFKTRLQCDPHIYDSPTLASLPQLDNHSLGVIRDLVKDKRKVTQARAQIFNF